MTDEVDTPNSAEAEEIDCLFELCKEDLPFLNAQEQTLNVGRFLNVKIILTMSYMKNLRLC